MMDENIIDLDQLIFPTSQAMRTEVARILKKTSKDNEGCKIRENFNFLKNGKIVISVKIRNFSRYRMTKRTSSLKSSREI